MHQRFEPSAAVGQRPLQMGCDIARHHDGTAAAGEEFGTLDIFGPDRRALGVIEDRQVDGAGDVVERELARAAHIDDGVKAVAGGGRQVGRVADHPAIRTRGGPSRTRPTTAARAKPSPCASASTASA